MAVHETLDAIAGELTGRFGSAPRCAIILGSGAGGLAARLSNAQSALYDAVGLPSSGVEGHEGRIYVGALEGIQVVILAGRLHLYEGHPPADVVQGVRALRRWGVENLMITSAVGSADPEIHPGDVVALTDHINLMGRNPLMGPHDPSVGPRFPDMTEPYSPFLRDLAHHVASGRGMTLKQGVYAGMLGPSYETAAEVRMLGALGANVIGMSVVPEVIAARQMQMQVLALAIVSNMGTGLSDKALTHEEVQEVVGAAAEGVGHILAGVAAMVGAAC